MDPTDTGIPFRVEFPVEVFEKASEDPDRAWRIGGIVSSEHPDRQGDTIKQSGLDFSDFIKNGWFNDNHSKETAGVVGYPEFVKSTTYKGKRATYVEGYLLKDYDRAKEIYKLAKALERTNRRLGFSVEGKIHRRIGPRQNIIAQATVRNVAITNCPVNTAVGMELLHKSLQAAESASESEWEKALMAGQSINNPGPSPGEGFPLRAESLESDVTDTTPNRRRKKKKKQFLTKAEAFDLIRSRYGQNISHDLLERIWSMAKRQES